MPGQWCRYQLSLDRFGEAVAEVAELGIPAVILFGTSLTARTPTARRLPTIAGSFSKPSRLPRQSSTRLADHHRRMLLRIHRDHGHCGPLKELGGLLTWDRWRDLAPAGSNRR